MFEPTDDNPCDYDPCPEGYVCINKPSAQFAFTCAKNKQPLPTAAYEDSSSSHESEATEDTSTGSSADTDASSSSSSGATAGIAVVGVVVGAILIVVVIAVVKRNKMSAKSTELYSEEAPQYANPLYTGTKSRGVNYEVVEDSMSYERPEAARRPSVVDAV